MQKILSKANKLEYLSDKTHLFILESIPNN